MSKASTGDIAAVLRQHQRWLVVSHANPDPDALGSVCALVRALRADGREAVAVLPDALLERYAFIPGLTEAVRTIPAGDWEGVLYLDCAAADRVYPELSAVLADYPLIINIDHHVSNTVFGDFNLIQPQAASTAEIVYQVIKELGVCLEVEIAEALLTGIIGDTGSFRYSSTSAETLRTAAELVEAGARIGRLANCLYGELPARVLRLQAAVLLQAEFAAEGRIVLGTVTPELLLQQQAEREDTENLVERLRDMECVRAAALISPGEEQRWKISLRSKDPAINVAAVAAAFGGGGHKQAAAFRSRLSLPELKAELLGALSRAVAAED